MIIRSITICFNVFNITTVQEEEEEKKKEVSYKHKRKHCGLLHIT